MAQAHEKVGNQRKDFLHKLSYQLTHEKDARLTDSQLLPELEISLSELFAVLDENKE